MGLKLFVCFFDGFFFMDVVLELKLYVVGIVVIFVVLCWVVSSYGREVCGMVRLIVSEVISVEVLFLIFVEFKYWYLGLCIELVMFNRVDDLL